MWDNHFIPELDPKSFIMHLIIILIDFRQIKEFVFLSTNQNGFFLNYMLEAVDSQHNL